MIDMSHLYRYDGYISALDSFGQSGCKWSIFEEVHKYISKDRCPICQYGFFELNTRLANSGKQTAIIPTIDHYRPQKYYSFLKCSHLNYLLMC